MDFEKLQYTFLFHAFLIAANPDFCCSDFELQVLLRGVGLHHFGPFHVLVRSFYISELPSTHNEVRVSVFHY
jgi:hypothetical protein